MQQSKQNNIKWRKSDNIKLVNAVRQFNGKLTRIIKNNPEINPFLPDRININQLRNNLKSGNRKEFNRELNRIRRFVSNKNSTDLIKAGDTYTTKWKLKNVRDDLQIINAKRKQRLKKFEPSAEKGNFATIKQLNLKPKKLENLESVNWKKFVESVEKQVASTYEMEMWEKHKANYIRVMNWDLFPFNEDIVPILERIPIEQWADLFEADDPDLTFDFEYGPEEVETKAQVIVEALQRHGIDTSLIMKKYEWNYEI